MPPLKQHQYDLLRYLVTRNSPTPVTSLDGRNLRPLKSLNLVVEVADCAVPTEAGRSLVQSRSGARNARRTISSADRLSQQQEDVLRYLIRQTGPVPEEHLDGRVLRALRMRGLLSEKAGWVSPSAVARGRLAAHADRVREPRGEGGGESSARAGAIFRALEKLEAALPRDAEITIGDVPAYGEDILLAFRRFARSLGVGGEPRRGLREASVDRG